MYIYFFICHLPSDTVGLRSTIWNKTMWQLIEWEHFVRKIFLFPCSNVSMKLLLNMQKRKKTLKVATEYPKESIKYEKQEYYFDNEKQIWMFLLQTPFCKCFLSQLSHMFWFTHSTALKAAIYIKGQLAILRMTPPHIWELNHQPCYSISFIWLQRSHISSSLLLLPKFTPENVKFRSSANCTMHANQCMFY